MGGSKRDLGLVLSGRGTGFHLNLSGSPAVLLGRLVALCGKSANPGLSCPNSLSDSRYSLTASSSDVTPPSELLLSSASLSSSSPIPGVPVSTRGEVANGQPIQKTPQQR